MISAFLYVVNSYRFVIHQRKIWSKKICSLQKLCVLFLSKLLFMHILLLTFNDSIDWLLWKLSIIFDTEFEDFFSYCLCFITTKVIPFLFFFALVFCFCFLVIKPYIFNTKRQISYNLHRNKSETKAKNYLLLLTLRFDKAVMQK